MTAGTNMRTHRRFQCFGPLGLSLYLIPSASLDLCLSLRRSLSVSVSRSLNIFPFVCHQGFLNRPKSVEVRALFCLHPSRICLRSVVVAFSREVQAAILENALSRWLDLQCSHRFMSRSRYFVFAARFVRWDMFDTEQSHDCL